MASKKERAKSSHDAIMSRYPTKGSPYNPARPSKCDALGRVVMLGDSFGRVGAQNLGSKGKAKTFKRFSVHN